jgi:hypothetical protein
MPKQKTPSFPTQERFQAIGESVLELTDELGEYSRVAGTSASAQQIEDAQRELSRIARDVLVALCALHSSLRIARTNAEIRALEQGK